MQIQVRDVQKYFGGFHALRGVSLDVASGELLALLGPSGSGKTTLLRAIAGLEPLDSGQVLFGDTDGEGSRFASTARGETERTAEDGQAGLETSVQPRQGRPQPRWIDATHVSVQERKVGFVFQQYALFKHMTVFDNIAFGLEVRPKAQRPSRGQIRQRVEQLLELVQLGGLGGRYPAQLSGGQKQRVALARALAIEPRVLLLDEPFGALDAKVRKDLRRWLRKLHRETGYTTIFVTHDQEEALELADRVVVMNRGQIEQVGTVDQVYDFPNTPFVFDFLGAPNVLPGEVRDGYVYLKGASAPIEAAPGQAAGEVDIYARPADFRVVDSDPAALEGQVVETHRYGILVRLGVQLRASGASIEIEIPNPDPEMKVWDAGDPIRVRPAHFSVFPRSLAAPAPAAATPAEEAQLEHSTSERIARMR